MLSFQSSFFGTVTSGFNNREVQIQWQYINTTVSIFFPIKILVTFRCSSRICLSTLVYTHTKKKKQQEKTKNNPKKPQTATTTKAEITFFGFYLAMEKQYFVQKNMY